MLSFLATRSLFDLETNVDERKISVSGELDLAAVDRLGLAARRLQQVARGDLTVCLRRTTFIDAAGLGVLVSIALTQKAHGDHFGITGTSPAVRRIIELVGLGHLLHPTARPAVAVMDPIPTARCA